MNTVSKCSIYLKRLITLYENLRTPTFKYKTCERVCIISLGPKCVLSARVIIKSRVMKLD